MSILYYMKPVYFPTGAKEVLSSKGVDKLRKKERTVEEELIAEIKENRAAEIIEAENQEILELMFLDIL